jgi:hypothetical protein
MRGKQSSKPHKRKGNIMHKELIHEETREGFTVRFYACEETDDPRGHFATGSDSDDEETIRKIYDGELTWFCAEVTASKEGVELGADYLGACCYETTKDFVTAGDYYEDMVNTAITEAKSTIAKLCNAA